jgi:hypothetical protein
MAFIGLAPFRQFQKHIGDTKFCFGSCQKEVDKTLFPNSGGRYCSNCANERKRNKRKDTKSSFNF